MTGSGKARGPIAPRLLPGILQTNPGRGLRIGRCQGAVVAEWPRSFPERTVEK